MDLKFEINGEVQLDRILLDAGKTLDNNQPFFKDAVDIIGKRSDDLFAQKGQNLEKSPKWKPHAESTKRARTKRQGYYKNPPNRPGLMRWTGNMQESQKKTVSQKFGKLEFTDEKAQWHWDGGGKSKLPQRRVIDLSNDTNRELVRAMQTAIYRQFGAVGLQSTM